MTNQSELEELDRLIIENQSEDGSMMACREWLEENSNE